MAAVLPTSANRTNKGRFCRAKAFIRNNNAADWLTASWFAIEKYDCSGECSPVVDSEGCFNNLCCSHLQSQSELYLVG